MACVLRNPVVQSELELALDGIVDSQLEQLRQRIEARQVEKSIELFDKLSSTELLHEIGVYHAELLAQNEELQSALVKENDTALANRALFDEAPVAYFLVTVNGDVEDANRLGKELLEKSKSRQVRSLDRIYDVDSYQFGMWLLNWKLEPLSLKYTASGAWHQLSKAKYSNDRILISITDTTELISSRDRYQDALYQLKQERSKLLQSVAIVGHELRTPLSSMKMMMDEQNITSIEPYGRDLSSIAEHLLGVLDDLNSILDPSNERHITVRSEIPYALVERVLSSMRFLFDKHGFRTKLSSDEQGSKHFNIPAQALRQIVTNLVKNAAVHSEGTEIRISLWVDSDRLTHRPVLHIQVADDGVGLSPDELKRVFEAFERGSTVGKGSGLGLHVCKQIAHRLGGSITAKSSPEDGTRMLLSLPISYVGAEDDMDLQQRLRAQLESKHVLLADDDRFQRMLMTKYLEQMGAKVTQVADGAEALSVLSNQAFDLLVSDLNMPKKDGLDVLRELAQQDKRMDSIIVTGGTDPDTLRRLKMLGAIEVLHKPVDANRIAQALLRKQSGGI